MAPLACPVCTAPLCRCGLDVAGVTYVKVDRSGPPTAYDVAPGVYPAAPRGGRVRLSLGHAAHYGLAPDGTDELPVAVKRRLRHAGIDPDRIYYPLDDGPRRDLLRLFGATPLEALAELELELRPKPMDPELVVDAPAVELEDTEPVPAGRVGDVVAWVDAGPDPLARARRALDAELERAEPRTTLVAELEARLSPPTDDPDDEDTPTP